jgi:hypothetical protein
MLSAQTDERRCQFRDSCSPFQLGRPPAMGAGGPHGEFLSPGGPPFWPWPCRQRDAQDLRPRLIECVQNVCEGANPPRAGRTRLLSQQPAHAVPGAGEGVRRAAEPVLGACKPQGNDEERSVRSPDEARCFAAGCRLRRGGHEVAEPLGHDQATSMRYCRSVRAISGNIWRAAVASVVVGRISRWMSA